MTQSGQNDVPGWVCCKSIQTQLKRTQNRRRRRAEDRKPWQDGKRDRKWTGRDLSGTGTLRSGPEKGLGRKLNPKPYHLTLNPTT